MCVITVLTHASLHILWSSDAALCLVAASSSLHFPFHLHYFYAQDKRRSPVLYSLDVGNCGNLSEFFLFPKLPYGPQDNKLMKRLEL